MAYIVLGAAVIYGGIKAEHGVKNHVVMPVVHFFHHPKKDPPQPPTTLNLGNDKCILDLQKGEAKGCS
jgi:hypothetical protein